MQFEFTRPYHPSRRALLRGVGALAGAVTLDSGLLVGGQRAIAAPMPEVLPRSAWGADHPPVGPLEVEAPGDVRFLMVHHSASDNDYGPGDVAGQIRSFYRSHTSPDKGWADIAYNFLVDAQGRIWEGRQGSINAPVKGSATGGSQGFAILCCIIGDLRSRPPTPEAEAAMTSLLAWQASQYGIDPEGSTSFISRGSNRHPAGTEVRTRTIAGHRDMSQTQCPGQFGYAMVRRLPPQVAAEMSTASVAAEPEPEPSEPATAADPTGPAQQPPTQPPPDPPVLPQAEAQTQAQPTAIAQADPPSAPPTAAEGPRPQPTSAAGSVPARPSAPPTSAASAGPTPLPTHSVRMSQASPPIALPSVPASDGPLKLTAATLLACVAAGLGAVINRRGLR